MSRKVVIKMLKLKEIRLNRGLKQSDIGNILGVTQQAVARYESEVRKLDQDQIIKLSLALDVTPDELLGFEEAYAKYTEYLKSLLKDEETQ